MDFSPNLAVLYAIFGTPVEHTPAASGTPKTEKAIYNCPGSTLYGGDALVTEHTLRYPAAAFPPVGRGDKFVINGGAFFAREPAQTIHDGAECVVVLGRV